MIDTRETKYEPRRGEQWRVCAVYIDPVHAAEYRIGNQYAQCLKEAVRIERTLQYCIAAG